VGRTAIIESNAGMPARKSGRLIQDGGVADSSCYQTSSCWMVWHESFLLFELRFELAFARRKNSARPVGRLPIETDNY